MTCPVCKSEVAPRVVHSARDTGSVWYVNCARCCIMGPHRKTREEAAAAFADPDLPRVILDQLRVENERLRTELEAR